jgi:sphinganine C4-monooxygenase
MGNMSKLTIDLPPLPPYTTSPLQSLSPYISDLGLTLLAPIAAYWILSLFFHLIDVYDVWPQYRLHTPAEILKRNHASRYEVARDVIIQQIVQVGVGAILGLTEPEQVTGKENYDIAWYAQKIRLAQRMLPQLLSVVGINAEGVAKNVALTHPYLAGALSGGHYMDAVTGLGIPAFTSWELTVAHVIYWYLVPAVQFMVGFAVLDTWQYFLHRLMHVNKWLYCTCSLSSLTC